MILRASFIAAAMALPTPAVAQTVAGTVSGRLDGDPASWSILDGEDVETGWQDVEGGARVTLDAYPEATQIDRADRLRIVFTAAGTAEEREAQEIEVTFSTGDTQMIAAGQNVDLSLNGVEIEGDSLVVSGNVTATLSEGGSKDLLIGEDRGTTIDGNFQATVFRAPE